MGAIGDAAIGIGTNAANNIVGAAMGLALEGHQDKRQLRQQKKLQELQIAGNKEMIDYQKMKDLETWKNTSYPAQMEMMKEAGINPALMYGMGGGGGQTTGGGGAGVSGAQAPSGHGTSAEMGIAMMNMQLMKAQKENIEADTNLKKVDAEKTGGVDTNKVAMEIESLQAGIADTRAKQALTEVQTDIAEIQKSYDQETLNDNISNVNYNLRLLKNNTALAEQTKDEIVKTVTAHAIGAVLQNGLTQAQTTNVKQNTEESKQRIKESISKVNLNKQELINASQKIALEWRALNQQDSKIAIDKFKAEMDANYPGLFDVIGSQLDGAIENLFNGVKGAERPKHHQIKQ